MTIDEIKAAIHKDNNLPDDVKKTAKEDLNRWLAKIGELYLLSPTMEFYSVGLNTKVIGQYICITNIFRLYSILDIKLFATPYDDKFMIYCNALGFSFAEIVSANVYNAIYKQITSMVSNFDIFYPYKH